MTLEDNKRVVRRFLEELFGAGNLRLLDELVAPHAVHVPANKAVTYGWEPGREGFRQHVSWFRNAYPDMHLTVDDLIAEEDRVVAFWTMGGTHQGEFFGVSPTGRHVVFTAIGRLRVVNGQVCEFQVHPDRLGILTQLGSLGRYSEQFAQAPTA
jgi:predicted ester cyclase